MASHERPIDVHGATLSRRQFVKTGGALLVGFGLVGTRPVGRDRRGRRRRRTRSTPSLSSSWFEIHADNTILMRTGKVDFGQSTAHTAYKQIVAEELNVPFEAITDVIMGDTDRTPDGGFSAGFLGTAAPTCARRRPTRIRRCSSSRPPALGVARAAVGEGRCRRRRRQAGRLRRTGARAGIEADDPGRGRPDRPVRADRHRHAADEADQRYTIIGQLVPNTVTPSKVMAKETWVTDVRLPGMLHGRVIHPKTLGSTLVAAGEVDKARFPNAQVVVKGNLVGVVAPSEWEAMARAAGRRGDQVDRLEGAARQRGSTRGCATRPTGRPRRSPKSEKSKGEVTPALAAAATSLTASYELPFMKHAPIGPTIAVGDVRADGTVYVHTHNQNPQALRGQLAMMLGTPVDNVVVRTEATRLGACERETAIRPQITPSSRK